MTLQEWVEKYNNTAKALDTFQDSEHQQILWDEEKGFIAFKFFPDHIHITAVCGDGTYWYNEMTNVAMIFGYSDIRGVTCRSPKAFIRKFGGSVKAYYLQLDLRENLNNT